MLAFALAAALVAADPPQTGAPSGVAAAGDVIAFAHDQRIEAFAGARRVNIAGRDPAVAAASDGTAIVASRRGSSLIARIRRPGAGFARTIRLGAAREYRVAAAPGGWVAAAWLSPAARRVEAAVVDPAGKVRHELLERGKDLRLSAPRVGIDQQGGAAVAWTFAGRKARRVTLVRTIAGRSWTRADGERVLEEATDVGLAVAPGGHALLAWATPRGVRVSLDYGDPQTLAAVRDAGSPAVSLAEDGSAVVAYATGMDIVAVDRAQAGPWSAPHKITGADPPSPGSENGDDVVIATTLAADGRALAGWAPGAIASGVAGGAWSPAQTVSSPVRLAPDPPLLALDASGTPFALWLEITQSTLAGRIHGVSLASVAPLPDTKPPTLTTRLPDSVAVSRNGAFSFSIPVACDEACDVRVNVYNASGRGAGYDLRELSLPAGGQATVRLSPSPYDERAEVKRQRPKRVRILVEVADRAGNLATAAGTARVQRR
jgi:hypothetical protein